MGYKKQNTVTGRDPYFGAIFMSNIETKKECFQRELFGLPLTQCNFVKHVKEGMVLFLFEYEKRQLFGVFRATSDGEINIAPNAFKSSGNQFPAQVQFTTIWNCGPLYEDEFRDAIRENYYSPKKFHFSLSEDQVRNLLMLFWMKRRNKKPPRRPVIREVSNQVGKNRRSAGIRNPISDCRGSEIYMDNKHERDFSSGFVAEDREKEMDGHLYLAADFIENDNKVNYELSREIDSVHPAESKGTQINNDARFLTNSVKENWKFDDDDVPRQVIQGEYINTSLNCIRTLADEGFMASLAKDDYKMYNDFGQVGSAEHSQEFFSNKRRVGDEDRFLMKNIRNERSIEDRFLPMLSEHHEKNLGKFGQANHEGSFLIDRHNTEHVNGMDIHLGSVRAAEQYGELTSEGSITNSRLIRRLQDERFLMDGSRPSIPTHHLRSPLRWESHDIRLTMTEIDKRDHKFSVEHPTGEHRLVNDEPGVNSSLKSIIPTAHYSRYNLSEEQQVADDGRFRRLDRIASGPEMQSFARPIALTNHWTSATDAMLQHEGPHRSDKLWHSSAHPGSKPYFSPHSYTEPPDAEVKGVIPYEPEDPDIRNRCLSYGTSKAYISGPPYPTTPDALLTRSNPCEPEYPGILYERTSHVPEESYGPYGSAPGFEDKISSLNKRHCSGYSKQNMFLVDGSLDNMGYTMAVGEGLMLPEPLASPDFLKIETTKSFNAGSFSISSRPSMDSSFAFNNGYRGTQGKSVYGVDEMFTSQELSSDAGQTQMGSGVSPKARNSLPHKDLMDHDTKYSHSHEDKRVKTYKRTSVFSRLTSGPALCVENEKTNSEAICSDPVPSVDDVRNLLHHSHKHQVPTTKKDNAVVRHEDESDKPSKVKIEAEVDDILEGIGGSVLQETRLVDFKRRRKENKNQNGAFKESSAGCKKLVEHVHSEDSAGKSRKRRKLVRPVFDKGESTDAITADSTANMQSIDISHANLQVPESNNEDLQVVAKSCEKVSMISDGVEEPASRRNEAIEAGQSPKGEGKNNWDLVKHYLNSLKVEIEQDNHKT